MTTDQKGEAAKRPRQAVVIIHGIGEQHPMETLRNFVASIVGKGPHDALSKPDRISPTLELRRMAVPGECSESGEYRRISTDFYELYWAHLMAGTSWHHVIAWARTLMLCWPTRVPCRLLPFWLLTWVLLLGAAWIYWMWRPDLVQSAYAATVVAAGVVTLRVFGIYFGLQYIGDAARYQPNASEHRRTPRDSLGRPRIAPRASRRPTPAIPTNRCRGAQSR